MANKVIQTSGKRKKSVARATLKQGKGVIRVNSQLVDFYKPDLAKNRILEPIMIAEELVNKINISVNVRGGGWQAQSESVRLAIAKGLVKFSNSKELRQKFLDYDRHLLIADVRQSEPCKPNNSKARAKRQKSYR
tara:strand:+ start:22612 stop:23016 length:405 start_codon:yes stop_codon:yes gene_type:complete